MIRANGMSTFVPDNRVCASACAIILLAGAPRAIGNVVHIGFHAAYSATTGQESGAANALVGAYLVGLNYKAIYFMTASGPESVAWLTADLANEWEVRYDTLSPPRALPVPTLPQLLPQTAARPAAIRAVVHRLLGAGLPMHVGLVLSPTILNIPEGASVVIEDDCSHQVSWAPWCLVTYAGRSGYVNGIYLTLLPMPPPQVSTPPQAHPAPPQLPQQSPQTTQGSKRPFRVVDVSDGFLQLRKGPGPQSEEVASSHASTTRPTSTGRRRYV